MNENGETNDVEMQSRDLDATKHSFAEALMMGGIYLNQVSEEAVSYPQILDN